MTYREDVKNVVIARNFFWRVCRVKSMRLTRLHIRGARGSARERMTFTTLCGYQWELKCSNTEMSASRHSSFSGCFHGIQLYGFACAISTSSIRRFLARFETILTDYCGLSLLSRAHPFAEVAAFPVGEGALVEPLLQGFERGHVDG